MNVLVLGGTKYMGINLVNTLIAAGNNVTIATRGNTKDSFGSKVKRLVIDRQNPESLRNAFAGKCYDVTIDNLAYSSIDVRFLLDTLQTGKYILTSTVSVYVGYTLGLNMSETDVDTKNIPLKWCSYPDVPYDEAKRQSEAALFQAYPNQSSVAVRFPYIFGKDDYTKRLFFYVDHILRGEAMHVDNITARLSFINSTEAGKFLTHVVTAPVEGYINAGSNGTISLAEIFDYVEKHTGKKALLHESGDAAPLNGVPSFSMDTTKATQSGFEFRDITDWVYPLVDFWIK